MIIIPFITTIFALVVLIKSYAEFRKGQETLISFLFWLITWSIAMLVAYFPKITDWIRDHFFGQGVGVGTILGVAIVFLLFLIYRLTVKLARLERLMNRLISDLALNELSNQSTGSRPK